jgi:hypothetical protein
MDENCRKEELLEEGKFFWFFKRYLLLATAIRLIFKIDTFELINLINFTEAISLINLSLVPIHVSFD